MAELSAEHRRYIRIETTINAVINAAISALFVWVAFRGMAAIPLWGNPGMALDLVPTCVAITLVSAVILTVLTRVRLARGRVRGLDTPRGPAAWLPRNLALRALTAALVVTAVAVPATIAVLMLVDADGASYSHVMAFKVLYGFALSVAISPALLLRALADAHS